MDISAEVNLALEQQEGLKLEFKAVLPPSKLLAQTICAFANADGGMIILGVANNWEVIGLSEDFHANTIVHKAIDMLIPSPRVYYQYVEVRGKKLYAIKVEKSDLEITLEGKVYRRKESISALINTYSLTFRHNGFSRILVINQQLELAGKHATDSKIKLIEHYQSILKIIDDLNQILYPDRPSVPTVIREGKILTRILFSSFVDTFETYLSDILYEIFLANPSTLKSAQTVTIEEVLNCSDLQEFVKYWSKQKLHKLQKGSVKGFVKENKQLSDLNVITEPIQNEIEKILQIRHLYSHRNGIVDEKFLQHFPSSFVLGTEHQLSIEDLCGKLEYLFVVANQIDLRAIKKYRLAYAAQ